MTLTTFAFDPLLDLAPWVGQRQCTYTFQLFDGMSGINKGYINPIRPATLSHDVSRTIKRTLDIALGVADTEQVDPVVDRIRLRMVFPSGQSYPLGTYMFTDDSNQVTTGGDLGSLVLNDLNFLVDQEITEGVGGIAYNPQASSSTQAADEVNSSVGGLLQKVLEDLPVRYTAEPSPFTTPQSWGIGTRRGGIIESLALAGDYFSPWFDHGDILRFIRAFNAASRIPDFDWDNGNQVIRSSALRSSNLLVAPNRFIVISNVPVRNGDRNRDQEAVGIATVPATAPNSYERRGFYITETVNTQASSPAQCAAMAQNLAERNSIFETVSISTAPDPRHDSYNVIRWQGVNWLEIGWSMTLQEGAPMSHSLRRSYR